MDVVWFLLIGLLAGFIAGKLMKTGDFGLVGNLVVGAVGAIAGGFVLGVLGFAALGLFARLVTATVGAMLFIALLRRFGRLLPSRRGVPRRRRARRS